ncbi:MAG: ATP-binding cassette domain-containing protein [Acidimicrobiales bacterium]
MATRLHDLAVAHLSAGQRRRTALACLIVRRPEIWLLDEPHTGLDAAARDLLDGLVRGGGRRCHRAGGLARARALPAAGHP